MSYLISTRLSRGWLTTMAFICVLLTQPLHRVEARPNVIVILADDLGYHDLGVQGATDILTPNIDSIARNSVRFTSGYVSAPICSPSRAGLMTGRYQQRFGYDMNPGPQLEYSEKFGIPFTETPMSQRFKTIGYTTGMIGKSHLGALPPYRPLQRGFDEFFGFLEGDHGYLRPGIPITQRDPIRRGDTPVPETNYLTLAFAREVVDFIDRHAAEPFFLYLPFNAVHEPLEATETLLKRFKPSDFPDTNRYVMAAMLSGLDDAVGAVLNSLRQHHLDTNTLIFFTSDNGGPTRSTGSRNDPLRGYKTEVYEGGIRVPFLMQWPGVLPSNTVYSAPVSTLDILPTAWAAAGENVSPSWKLDGVNLLPFVSGQTNGKPHPNLYWRIESEEEAAIRSGDWKLLRIRPASNWQLYNLAQDVGEQTDLADQHPEVVQDLIAKYDAWAAQLQTPAWAYNQSNYVRPDFVMTDVRIGTSEVSYNHPDFLPGSGSVAFQDSAGTLWQGEIDLVTGFFRSVHGRDVSVDSGLANIQEAVDGPHWGRSANGASIYYTKVVEGGRSQIWRARTAVAPVSIQRLTDGGAAGHFGPQASQDSSLTSSRLVFAAGQPAQFGLSWMDEASASSLAPLPRYSLVLPNGHWLPEGTDLALAAPASPLSTLNQIARYRTESGALQMISGDPGDKTDVWAFHAPEWSGELCYAAVVDHSAIAIYRDLGTNAAGLFTRVATLTVPITNTQRFVYSMEPIQGLRGFNGISYFSCASYTSNDPNNPGDSAIWVFGLGPDPAHPIIRRVDEGSLNGEVALRHDPRTLIGDREVLLYYNVTRPNEPTQLRLAKTGLVRPDHTGNPDGFSTLAFQSSWTPGTRDTNGVLMGGTETLSLVAHQGRLFAGVGARQDEPYPPIDALPPLWTGAQILVKESAEGLWKVDASFADHLQVEVLKEIEVTTLGNGSPLKTPAKLLLAGLRDLGDTGSRLASARTRDDSTGKWIHSQVTRAATPAATMSFGSHVDRVSGVHYIFAGLSNGEIFRGTLDPQADGGIQWAAVPELSGVGAITEFAEANGFLYAACGLRQASPNGSVTGGLYVRRDNSSSWQVVYRWPGPTALPSAAEEDRLVRGLTTVRDPHGAEYQSLLFARSWSGLIERVDPTNQHAATVELDVRDFFARRWGSEAIRQARVQVGYNSFTLTTNPVTAEPIHLIGVWIEDPSLQAGHRGSHFLIRHLDGTYAGADIPYLGATTPSDRDLRGNRCIAVSPFPADAGQRWYFGGYDAASDLAHDTAWILRGEWAAWPALTLSQPAPPEWQVSWPLSATNWVLETRMDLGAGATWQAVPGLPTRSLSDVVQGVAPQDPSAYFRLRRP
jgi:arylsulfatase A-like enzyme